MKSEYERTLAEIVAMHPFTRRRNRVHYHSLLALVDEQVLADAFGMQDDAHGLFGHVGRQVTSRPEPKSYARFLDKARKGGGEKTAFRAIRDFIGIRVIEKDLHGFRGIRDAVLDIVAAHRGISRPKRDVYRGGELPNRIADYHYVYLPELAHLVEVQIVHPFAALAFTENSQGRRNPVHVSLFRDSEPSFYDKVQAEILGGRPNGEALYRELQALHRAKGGKGRHVSDAMRDTLRAL